MYEISMRSVDDLHNIMCIMQIINRGRRCNNTFLITLLLHLICSLAVSLLLILTKTSVLQKLVQATFSNNINLQKVTTFLWNNTLNIYRGQLDEHTSRIVIVRPRFRVAWINKLLRNNLSGSAMERADEPRKTFKWQCSVTLYNRVVSSDRCMNTSI